MRAALKLALYLRTLRREYRPTVKRVESPLRASQVSVEGQLKPSGDRG
jgi:hypothetical protein